MTNSEIILYTTPQGDVRLEVIVQDETVWLTQKAMGELFGVAKSTISEHLSNIFVGQELIERSVVRKIRTTAADGKNYNTQFYNLDAIISVGYRVNSQQATQFRIWATKTLKDSECSIDYDPKAEITVTFYKTVQNKLHWAITGQTAAELISKRADAELPNMGLTTWKNSPKGKVLRSDVSIAKNYLYEQEITELNRVVTMYLDYAENQAARQIPMKMKDWVDRLDAFLQFNDYSVLKNAGTISAEIARKLANDQYEKFRVRQDSEYESDFDREIKRIKGEK